MAPLDPILASIAARSNKSLSAFEGTPEEARARLTSSINSHRDPDTERRVRRISDEMAFFGDHRVPVRISWPHDAPGGPILIFVHGGGHMLLTAELSDNICTRLSAELGAVVVAVDYRLSPEHPFPAALDDVEAATRWTMGQARRLSADDSPIVIMGHSSGANIAAAVALLLAEQQALDLLVVVAPATDDLSTENLEDVPHSMLRLSDMKIMRHYYFGADLEAAAEFAASSMTSPNLGRTPRTIVALAGHDPVLPVGEAYALRLEAAGVPVHVLRFPAMSHAFLGFAHVSPGADRALATICDAIRSNCGQDQIAPAKSAI